jgi:GMP synthase-like glutamine amidotransferase
MHRDIVVSLPDGAENLGATETCKIQGMVDVKGRYISVQGHPEFTEEIVTEILGVRKQLGVFGEEQYAEMMSRVGNKHDGVSIAEAFLRFVEEGRGV